MTGSTVLSRVLAAHSQAATPKTPSRLIRRAEVLGLVGLSKSTVYQHMADGTFPAPVRLGRRAVAWRLDDVLTFIESRVSARPSSPKAA